MLDIKFIRENKDLVIAGAKKKRISCDIDGLLKLDDKRRELLASIEKKRAEQNLASEKIARETQEKSGTERLAFIANLKILKESMAHEDEEMKDVMKKWQTEMVSVPNIPDISVPEGGSDADNKEVKTFGDIPSFDFPIKSHTELTEALGLADFESGAKIAGFRGYVLMGGGALLSQAIWHYGLNFFTKERKDFTPMIVPSLARKEVLLGTGYLPQGAEDLYMTQDGDYFSGTAEVGVMGHFADSVIDRARLPIKIIAFSPCFRREAGSHGKDTKGLIRVHEFFKLEQVVLCEASHTESVKYHEEITENAEALMRGLGLPYRVVVNCGADLGLGQVKKYDIEAWVPSEGKFRETHSSSYFHDFQSRRLNIRYRDAEGKLRFVHSLNSTALPTPRILVPIIENNQQKDGSVVVPEALRLYVGEDVLKSD